MNQTVEEQMKPYFKMVYPFWERLDAAQKKLFCANSRLVFQKKGSFVHEGANDCLGILIVRKGSLRIYIQSDDGREITLYRLGERQACTLSSSCILEEITFDVMIEAEEDSQIIVTNTNYFNQLMKSNIYVENYAYRQTTERFSDVMWAMQQILFKSFDKRLAEFLLEEARRAEKAESEAVLPEVEIKFTHEQIAKYLGTAREVVSRMLKYFEEEGAVCLGRGKIIVNLEKVKRIAGMK